MLRYLKAKAEGKISELEVLLSEKEENLMSVTIVLERTQKNVEVAK